ASEILAGALQDREAATLVGTKSYGKGSVQVVVPLFHDDGLKLTIAKYYTPNGRCIDGIGIEPDVTVNLTEDSREDTQLNMAKEVLQGKMSQL
ncbi:MAG: S41 family peptidase, partial [Selenomonas sp.]|nr:S41 family peptidase [Selenomonas sp.]